MFDSAGNRIAEYNQATGVLIREYIWLDGAPIAVVEGGVIYFVRTDHIGRPVFATNAAGAKVWMASLHNFSTSVRDQERAATGEQCEYIAQQTTVDRIVTAHTLGCDLARYSST